MLPVFDAHAPPYVFLFCRKPELSFQQALKPICTLGENLVSMPVCRSHYPGHRNDVVIRNVFVEKVAHRVHKNHPRSSPSQRFAEFFRNKAQVETKLERMPRHVTESLSERLGIAMQAPRTDFSTTSYRVPSCVRPFNFRFVTHC